MKKFFAVLLSLILLTQAGCTLFSDSSGKQTETPDNTETPTVTAGTDQPAALSETPAQTETPAVAAAVNFKKPGLTYKAPEFTASVTPYSVKADLSDIVNISQFVNLTENQRSMLAKNLFVVTPSSKEQMSFIYENNEYLRVPSFISSDSILQVYHLFFDFSLRNVEKNFLFEAAEKLNKSMLNKTLELYNSSSDEQVKAALTECLAYFIVGQRLAELELPEGLPDGALSIADTEYERVTAHNSIETSQLNGDNLFFYEQFTVRGHYSTSEDMGRYFRLMMWYGTMFYPVSEGDGLNTLKTLLTTYALMDLPKEDGSDLWESIYSPTAFFVGSSDDLTPYDVWNEIIKQYKDITPDKLNDPEKYSLVAKNLEDLYKARIVNENITEDDVKSYTGTQFRFMGQRYIPDSEIMQRLSKPILRPVPSGLDVAAVLGADNAEKYVEQYLKPAETWPAYPEEYAKVKQQFSELDSETWQSNMYYGWLWAIDTQFDRPAAGMPSFMQNEAWYDKQLATGLGSWSELRHDTILYAKQSGAEKGGGWEDRLQGYVEPNIELYSRLKFLTEYSLKNLELRGYVDDSYTGIAHSGTIIIDVLDTLINISQKELKNEALSEEDLRFIEFYGGTLESLSVSISTDGVGGRWYEITQETDRNMALCADVHTTSFGSLIEAVGTASEIYVVIPAEGKLYLTRGAVFDYYEFFSENKLTDEEWQTMLKSGAQPERPQWTKSFIDLTGIDREIPPADTN